MPHLIVLSLHQHREAEGKQEESRYSVRLSRYSSVVGQLLVCIHTAGHHMLQFTGQFELAAISSADVVSMFVGTNVSQN